MTEPSAALSVAMALLEPGTQGEPYQYSAVLEHDLPVVLTAEHLAHGEARLETAVRELLGLAQVLAEERRSPTAAETLRRAICGSLEARAFLETHRPDLAQAARLNFAALIDQKLELAPAYDAPAPEGSVKLGGMNTGPVRA